MDVTTLYVAAVSAVAVAYIVTIASLAVVYCVNSIHANPELAEGE